MAGLNWSYGESISDKYERKRSSDAYRAASVRSQAKGTEENKTFRLDVLVPLEATGVVFGVGDTNADSAASTQD